VNKTLAPELHLIAMGNDFFVKFVSHSGH